MPNRIWQAEEEKWEKRRIRAEKMLTHIRELRRLEAEEDADEQSIKPVGQPTEAAVSRLAPRDPTPAPLPPAKLAPLKTGDVPANERRKAKEIIPELLAGGPMTMKALALKAKRSQQAISNALTELKEANVVKEEPSTFPGFRYQYRLTTPEERASKPQIRAVPLSELFDQEEDQQSD